MRWIGAPAPASGQLLSSWVHSLAWSQGLNLQRFLHRYWGRGSWSLRAMDRAPQREFMQDLSAISGTDIIVIERMSLVSALLCVNEDMAARASPRWLLQCQAASGKSLGHGCVYCAQCLKSDTYQHLRVCWRLSWSVVCENHRLVMRDTCWHCNHPVDPSRLDSPVSARYEWPRRLRCQRCQSPYDEAKQICAVGPETESVLNLVTQMRDAAENGWALLNGRAIFSHAWFSGTHSLCQFVCCGKHSEKVLALLGIEHATVRARASRFDASVVTRRLAVMSAVVRLLANWPCDLLSTFDRLRITRWDLLGMPLPPPFWFEQALVCLPSRRAIAITSGEVEAAFCALDRHGPRHPTMVAIARSLGRQHFPIRFVQLYRSLRAAV
jgi:TniQ